MSYSISIKGDKELMRKFEQIPKRSQKTGMRRGINLACSPIVRDAKARAPRGQTKLLRKSYTKKLKTYRGGTVVGIVGASTKIEGVYKSKNATRPHRPGNIAHLVEQGHGGKHPARPYPHLKPAYQAHKASALSTVRSAMEEAIMKEVRK